MESVLKAPVSMVPSSPTAGGEPIADPGIEALRVAAHDLKTPLTTIKTLAQIFKLSAERGTIATQLDRTNRNCDMLLQQVDKLAVMADVLIDASRTQAGRMKFDFTSSDLRLLVQSAVTHSAGQVAKVILPDEPVQGMWDTFRLMQAFSHLFSMCKNAEVELLVESGHAYVRIDGDFSAAPRNNPRLYIANAIIARHGGTLDSQFLIELPL